MITHLELDVLKCEVKEALRSITTSKASGGDGTAVVLFQTLKDDAVKVLHLTLANVESSAVATGLKGRFHCNSKERRFQRMFNYHTLALISHSTKVISPRKFQQYMNCELSNVQAGFRKGRGTRGQIAIIHWIIEKARKFQK